jgi:hypothetical protein
MLEIYHKFFVPFIMAVCLTLGKKLADNNLPSLEDANDVALDLIMVSIGAMAVFHATGWTADQFQSAAAWDVLLALALLTRRAQRVRTRASLKAGRKVVPVGIVEGLFELLAGLMAVYMTIAAR